MPQSSHPQSKPAASGSEKNSFSPKPAVLLDLDGTLVDSSYEHVMAWAEAFAKVLGKKIHVPNAAIHRCIGMGGTFLVRTIFAEMGRRIDPREVERLDDLHGQNFDKRVPALQLLPGAPELLARLSRSKVRWAIATSGDHKTVQRMLKPLRVPAGIPVITGDHVERAKPDPDVFFQAAKSLKVDLADCVVVGDSIWDMLAAQRAKALGAGLLCGGYSEMELIQAGAYRVYRHPADLLERISEIGIYS
jgi:HAD superfamily hydrolase (TIGR01509 family)